MTELIPVTIFSGYLGAGKTTVILQTLKQYATPPRFAMIKNEYGDASVDGTLARSSNLAVKELVNGCLCCVLVGSLNAACDELIETIHPERILIEASGNALPFPIVLELRKNPRVYVDGVIWVVDCVNFPGIRDKSVVAREQAKYTDLIVFNKTNLVNEDALYGVKEDVFDIHPDTKSVDTVDGMLDPAVLFGIGGTYTESNEVEAHVHEDLETFVFETGACMDSERLQQVLGACESGSFYRIKGIVEAERGVCMLVNSVFGRLELRTLATDTITASRLVFIGKGIKRFEPMIRDYLEKAVISA